MRILNFSTHDLFGGASKAAYRLHTALRSAGHSSSMIVRYKESDDEDVHQVAGRPLLSGIRRAKRHLPLFNGVRPPLPFNFDKEPEIDTRVFFSERPGSVDIICLHWITNLLTIKKIRQLYEHYRCPIVWLPMDQEAVTGGCHYSLGCDGFTRQCGYCPQLNSTRAHDRSRTTWNRKRDCLQDLPLVFVACTSWVMKRIRESSLFKEHRVELIPLAIDANIFRPFDQRVARDLLHLPQNKKIIFFGATYLEQPHKGMSCLADAIKQLPAIAASRNNGFNHEEVFLLVAGANGRKLLETLPFPGKAVGHLNEDIALALAYQAADIFVCPSVEDAGPMMIPEAMLCGTPVVAFNTGGAPDLIESLKTGFLAKYKDSADLGQGIYTLLATKDLSAIRVAARQAALQSNSVDVVAERHLKLYQSLLDDKRASEANSR